MKFRERTRVDRSAWARVGRLGDIGDVTCGNGRGAGVLKVTLKVRVPAARVLFAGSVALASLEVIATVSFVFTTFQFASTELTVTLKAVPAVCVEGVPVLPLAVPGAAVSPGANNCSLVKVPAVTEIDGLVLAVFVPSSKSVAVTV